jgi:hypothetical protein
MDINYELEQSEQEFRKITEMLHQAVGNKPYGLVYDAYILAWRMWTRLEEQRLRHPSI